MSDQTLDEIATAWQSLPAHVRTCLLRQIQRGWPDTKGATITEVDVSELDAGEAEFDGERLAIIMLSTHHMYGMSFVPRPPGGDPALSVHLTSSLFT